MRKIKSIKRSACKRIVYAKEVLSEVLYKSFYAGEFGTGDDGFAEFCKSLLYNISVISSSPLEDVAAMATVLQCGSFEIRWHDDYEFIMPSIYKCCKAFARTRRRVRHGEGLNLRVVYTEIHDFTNDKVIPERGYTLFVPYNYVS